MFILKNGNLINLYMFEMKINFFQDKYNTFSTGLITLTVKPFKHTKIPHGQKLV